MITLPSMKFSFPVSATSAPSQSCSPQPIEIKGRVAAHAGSDLQIRLSRFIQYCLKQSCSTDCSTDEALQLLDKAWKAQKLLWQIRRQAD
jgi:hypothetical protein